MLAAVGSCGNRWRGCGGGGRCTCVPGARLGGGGAPKAGGGSDGGVGAGSGCFDDRGTAGGGRADRLRYVSPAAPGGSGPLARKVARAAYSKVRPPLAKIR